MTQMTQIGLIYTDFKTLQGMIYHALTAIASDLFFPFLLAQETRSFSCATLASLRSIPIYTRSIFRFSSDISLLAAVNSSSFDTTEIML